MPPWGTDDRKIELWVFCGIINEKDVRQMEDEQLVWIETKKLYVEDNLDHLAGDGNIPYFVNIALKYLKGIQ